MNPLALLLFLACALGLLAVPRKWAPVVLLVGCTYMTMGQGIELGPVSLPIFRMLLLVGVVRVIVKAESIPGGLNRIDKLMIAWGAWVVFASFFHDPERAGPVYAAGAVFNQSLFYFLLRIWTCDLEDVADVIVVVAILLTPVAAEMAFEVLTGKNLFAVFGGVPEDVVVRGGKYRAQGPFRHPILAGTVGATCVPLFVGILKRRPSVAWLGIAAGVVMVFASSSSGPVMTLLAALAALILWKWKHWTRTLRVGAVVMYGLLALVMEKPPYYLISRIDISGGSTGWHRSFLIEQTIAHLPEWWLFGTDHTRHWMPMQGIARDPNHTDVTNYYIGFGIMGGLPALLMILGMLWVAFRWVGWIHDARVAQWPDHAMMIWCFGACLFSHAVTGISVSYFDQSALFFWLSVAVISSTYAILREPGHAAATGAAEDAADPLSEAEALARANAEWRRKLWQRAAANPRCR